MKNLPSITILTGTLNTHLPTFRRTLKAIKSQNYPKDLIEHIVLDSGSTNGTLELAKRYGCKIINLGLHNEKQQAKAGIGIKMAKGKLIVILESDNIIVGNDWLLKMVKPFAENKEVFCSFSLHNAFEKDMSLTTKYCALFGSPEPTLYYLDKSEKMRMDQTHYNKGEVINNAGDYFIVKFNSQNLPTLGDNGHMFLREAMFKVIKDPADYLHTDAFAKLLKKGFNTFAVVKNSVIHVQNSKLFDLIKRRVEVKRMFYDGLRGRRNYLVMNWDSKEDKKNLAKYVFFSITIVIPLLESIRGYLKIREKAWFLHPILCFLMVIGYGWSEAQWIMKKNSG